MTIRRFYVMVLKPGASPDQVAEAISGFTNADKFINGLVESSASVDITGTTIVWEMKFSSEEFYSGEYLQHPYHAATLDQWLIGDSPEEVTQNIFTARYKVQENTSRLHSGIRRLTLLNLPEDANVSVLNELSNRGEGVVSSVIGIDDIAFRFPGKKTEWTHIWEQAFTDMAASSRYLESHDGITSSSKDRLKQLGVPVNAFQSILYPFQIKEDPPSPAFPTDNEPVFYVLHARMAPEDAEKFISLLKRYYDQALARVGIKLYHRWQTINQGYLEAEVHSTWQLKNVSAYSAMRVASMTDSDWAHFVTEGMPLIRKGTRRFYRSV